MLIERKYAPDSKEQLIDALTKIAKSELTPIHLEYGLCAFVHRVFSTENYIDFLKAMRTVCVTWKHYSGDAKFPVPHPEIKETPNAHLYYTATSDKYSGEYGRLRRELAGLVAEELRTCYASIK